MTCYHPISLYKSSKGPDPITGKWALTGKMPSGPTMPKSQTIPCGRCIGCRLERSRQWAIRIMNEAQMHEDNLFLTLTYNDRSIKWGRKAETLCPRDLQLFFKRLRKKYGQGIRYFSCGEYGELTHRPHYHAAIFNLAITDKNIYSKSRDNILYNSPTLDKLWSHGNTVIGSLTFESAAYVARYIMGKKLGKSNRFYEDQGIEPEFVRMSRGGTGGLGGIGQSWLEKFQSDIYPHDKISIRGHIKCKTPRYYLEKYGLSHPLDYDNIKMARKEYAEEHWKESEQKRLDVKERVKKAATKSLTRNL